MKCLVTGGAGFIGSHLCERLLKKGHQVFCLDNLSTGKRENINYLSKNFNFYNRDVSDYGIEVIFKDIQFDYVFHQAASKKTICLKDPKKDLDVNGKGTLNLLQLSKKYGVKKFIHASTGSVYGEVNGLITEVTAKNPCSYYGISKNAGESYVSYFNKEEGLNTTILRYFHVYGSRQDNSDFGGVIPIFIKKIMNDEPITIFGDGKQERSFTYVDDVVNANIISIDKGDGEIYNCASALKVTIIDVAKYIALYLDKDLKIEYAPETIGDIKYFDISNKKIKFDYSLEFSDFQKSLIKTIDSYVKI